MAIEIIVPRLGWSMEEGAFVAWLKQDGEFVRAGEALFSIEGDKAVQEVESIDSGILRIAANCPKPGDSIRVGDVLGHLLSDSEASAPRDEPGSAGIPASVSPHDSPAVAEAGVPKRRPSVEAVQDATPQSLPENASLGRTRNLL